MSPAKVATPTAPSSGLSRLLDDQAGRAWPGLLLVAFVLGAAHAIQPGHGKTLVAAASIGPGGGPFRGALLGLATAAAHLSSVALIALAIAMTRFSRFGELHLAIARLAGFAIAAIGLWRLGRHLGGYGEHGRSSPPKASVSGGSSPLAWPGGWSHAGTRWPWWSSRRRSAGSDSG